MSLSTVSFKVGVPGFRLDFPRFYLASGFYLCSGFYLASARSEWGGVVVVLVPLCLLTAPGAMRCKELGGLSDSLCPTLFCAKKESCCGLAPGEPGSKPA